MRSSGLSGAGALGFRVGKTEAKARPSAVSRAIATTAFLAAGLFAICDAVRTYSDANRELAMIGAIIAAEIADQPPEMVSATIGQSAERFGNIAHASLAGDTLTAQRPLMHIVPAGQHGNLTLEIEQNQTVTGIAGRGAVAFALAGLFTLASTRRRQSPVPAGHEGNPGDTLLDTIREQQRQLARRYHEEKLKAEAASRAKTSFLAHLSHDVRTPLNHIIGFAELMEHETYGALGDARYRDYVQSIKSSGQNLLNSFAAVLDLAELEGGQKALRQDPVLLDDVLETVATRFRGQIRRAGLTFKTGPATGAVLRGDRLGLVRMVGNIMDNAVRFTGPGGTITLAAFAAHDGVVIEISDTGIGMSEERLASLSQPFALGDATFTRDSAGPGLGISIARAIAELSDGHIAIDSSPSLGTTVAISLPTEPAAAELAA